MTTTMATNTKMSLVDWLDELCVRFIVNLPNEELQSVERICFQIEEAQWFYEDFIRPLDPNNLPSMHLRKFSQLMFQHCPLFSAYSEQLHQLAYEQFLAYKTRVPVRGAIMLNQEMTHAVLVKGWKKGAKWSFPRGKINKEESDLDCAVREVYEETGYDLTDTGLVKTEPEMKSITVTMREQSMMLYVFRGVPMDTYFEPRTRKEISKIDWYKLTDLPTLRRKNQVQQQSNGQDQIKESSFYMVAPFLGPLRAWIKQQHKLDRQKARNGGASMAAPVGVAITDDEDVHPEPYDSINPMHQTPLTQDSQPDSNLAHLVANLGRTHRPSDALPELSVQSQTEQTVDPAAELKRLLSVGRGMQSPPVEAPGLPTPGQQAQENPLLALFRQDNPRAEGPQTPFDQVMPPPMQPSSPHGQHHPRPPQIGNMPPPPPFPFPPHQNLPFRGPPPSFENGAHTQMPPNFMSPPQYPPNPMFPPSHAPMHPGMHGQGQAPQNTRPFQQANDGHAVPSQSFHISQSQSFGAHGPGPAIPPASKLPAPKMNAHTLGLLNAFKSNAQQPVAPQMSQSPVQIQDSPTTQKLRQQPPQHQPNELASPHFQSPPINIQPAQPKPRSAHQDSLLTLFRATPPISSPEPAELSALPTTPGYVSAQPAIEQPKAANASLLNAFANLPKPVGLTSATVRGPVNAPDFDTMKKHSHHTASGSSRGPSPATYVPQQILKREQPPSLVQSPSEMSARNGSIQDPSQATQTAFKPQILKRPQQHTAAAPGSAPSAHAMSLLDMFKGPSPQPGPTRQVGSVARSPAPPTPQGSLNHRESTSDQKNTLLALFGKPSPKLEGSRIPASNQQDQSPMSTSRGTLPPTPKTTMSGVISPVSPLPEKDNTSPVGAASRSRISSIGDSGPPSIVIPPTSHPTQSGDGIQGYSSGLSAQSRSATDGKSPVDKTFLLGFLEDVARRGR